jgi:hypothetical protein
MDDRGSGPGEHLYAWRPARGGSASAMPKHAGHGRRVFRTGNEKLETSTEVDRDSEASAASTIGLMSCRGGPRPAQRPAPRGAIPRGSQDSRRGRDRQNAAISGYQRRVRFRARDVAHQGASSSHVRGSTRRNRVVPGIERPTAPSLRRRLGQARRSEDPPTQRAPTTTTTVRRSRWRPVVDPPREPPRCAGVPQAEHATGRSARSPVVHRSTISPSRTTRTSTRRRGATL